MLFLCPERALYRSRPYSGKLLSDKAFLLFLLTEQTASFHERCLYSVLILHVKELLSADVGFPIFCSTRTSSQKSSQSLPSATWRQSNTTSRSHSTSHQCTSSGISGQLPFRSEARPESQLRPHAFPHQTEVICHLAERKQLLYPVQFALFES